MTIDEIRDGFERLLKDFKTHSKTLRAYSYWSDLKRKSGKIKIYNKELEFYYQ